MATASVDAFMNALIGQESGGDPNAQNERTNAYGIGQIMPENWVPWALEAGADPNDYSEANQRKIIRFKLTQYFNSFGRWEDVASAWYSGQPMSYWSESTLDAPQGYGNEPSIREYVNSVMSKMDTGSVSTAQYAPRADNLSEPFGSRLDALLAAFGGRVWVNSGYRSEAEQAVLWENSDKSGIMVAPPGGSYHNKGMAVDLGYADEAVIAEVHAVASDYGLWFPMDYENWHIEPIGSRDGTYVEAVDSQGVVKSGAGILGVKGWDIPLPGNPLGGVKDTADAIKAVFGWFSFHNFIRLGQFLLGTALFLFGIATLTRKPAMNIINTAVQAKGTVL